MPGQTFLTEIDLSAVDNASPKIDAVTGKLEGIATAVASLSGVNLGDFGVDKLIQGAAEGLRILEQVRNSVAGMVYAFTDLTAGGTELASGTERITRATAEAGVQLEGIRAIAIRLGLDIENTSRAYAGMFVAMTKLGGSGPDQLAFFDTMAKSARVLGIDLDTISQGISRMVATGTIMTRGPFGQVMRSLGISNEDLKTILASGDGLAILQQKFQKLADAADQMAPTFDRAMQMMRNALKEGLGDQAAKPLLDAVKAQILSFVSFVTSGPGAQGLSETFKQMGVDLADIATKVGPLLQDIFSMFVQIAGAIVQAADKFMLFIGPIRTGVQFVTDVTKALGGWAPAIMAAVGAMGTFAAFAGGASLLLAKLAPAGAAIAGAAAAAPTGAAAFAALFAPSAAETALVAEGGAVAGAAWGGAFLAKASALMGGLASILMKAIPVALLATVGSAGAVNLMTQLFGTPEENAATAAMEKAKNTFLNMVGQVEAKVKDPALVAQFRTFYKEVAGGAPTNENLQKWHDYFVKLAHEAGVGTPAGLAGDQSGGFDTTPVIPPATLDAVKLKLTELNAEIIKDSAQGSMSKKILGEIGDYNSVEAGLVKLAGAWRGITPEVDAMFAAQKRIHDLKMDEAILAITDATEKLRAKNVELAESVAHIGLEGTAKTYATAFDAMSKALTDADVEILRVQKDVQSFLNVMNPNDPKQAAAAGAMLDNFNELVVGRTLQLKKGMADLTDIVRAEVKSIGEDTFKAMVDDLKAQGRDYEAAWDDLNHATEEKVRLFNQLIAMAALAGDFANADKLRAALAAYKEATASAMSTAGDLAQAEKAMASGDLASAWKAIAALPATTYPQYQANMQKWIDLLTKFGTDGAAGIQLAFAEIVKGLGTEATRAHDLVVSLWNDLDTSLKKGFFDVLSGNFSDLKNAAKSLWDSILQSFADMLAKMAEKWLASQLFGQGGSGQGLLGGLLGGGASAVYTPQGTGNAYGNPLQGYGYEQQPGFVGQGQYGVGYQGTGGGNTVAYLGYAAAAILTVATILKDSKQNTATASYQGVNLGQQNYGGNANFGADVTPFISTAVMVGVASGWTGVGLIAAIVIAIVGVIVAGIESIINGPAEGHVKIAIAEALSGAGGAIGGFVSQIFDATTNYVGQLALKAAGPEGVGGYVAAYKKAFADALGSATFDIHAGSAEDMQADIKAFFESVLPKLALQAAFGQVGYGPPGNSNMPGGAAGLDWNTNNAAMDQEGNWIQHQLYDPTAPIPMMLAGLGFTADEIGVLATKLRDTTDIKAFSTWLQDLVGVVVDLSALAQKFGQSADAWFAFIHKTQAEVGTAAEFADATAHFKAGGELLATIFGDDRVAAAKTLVAEGQTLLNNEGQALANILSFIDQIATQYASTIQTYKGKVLTPAENEAALRADATTWYAAISAAMNPKDVAAAWSRVLGDMTALLDIIAARIDTIKALQQSYADFRTQMATDAGPQFGTDPAAWLAKNQAAIDAIDWSDPIKGAQTLLDLEKTRYSNLYGMLQNVDAAIKSIDATSQSAIQNLQMQAMGSVTTDPKTGAKTWTPDVHAQGEFLNQQYQSLMGQLGTATTTDQINSIMGQINSVINQLAGQPQDPTHYAESRRILIQMQQDAQRAADKMLATMHDSLTAALKGIGDQLKLGEKALVTALGAAEWDFKQALHNLGLASDAATLKLNSFADALVTAMNQLVIAINGWIALFTGAPVGGANPVGGGIPIGGGGGVLLPPGGSQLPPGQGGSPPIGVPGSGGGGPGPGGGGGLPVPVPVTAPPIQVSVTVNSGTPEEIAQAAGQSTYQIVLDTIKASNTELVRQLRNNPQVLVR